MISTSYNPWKRYDHYHEEMFEGKTSEFLQWPVKLWKTSVISPYFHQVHLLIAADCSAFDCPTLHDKLSKGKVPLICCTESDFDITTKLKKSFLTMRLPVLLL